MSLQINKNSKLTMFKLGKRQENEEEILIGRQDFANYILLPTIGVDIIEMLAQGMTIQEVENIMEERTGEAVDVLSFATDLVIEYQFVHMVDDVVVNEPGHRKDHFAFIPESICRFFFHPLAFCIYVGIFLSGLVVALIHHQYLPYYQDIFTANSVSISYVTLFVTFMFFLFLHELAHLMAARSLGVGSRLQLSHRLYFMVAETDMSNIVLVEPRKRHIAYLAGMAWDVFFLGICIWLLYANDLGWIELSPYAYGFVKMLNFSFFSSLGYQFAFFTRTDLYYVFSTLMGCRNLFHNTRLYMVKFYKLWTPQQEEEWNYVDLHEKRIVKGYLWFFLFGYGISTVYFVFLTLPQLTEFITRAYHTMAKQTLFSVAFWDGLLFFLLALTPTGVVVWSWIRTMRERSIERKRRAALLGQNQSV